MAKQRYVITLSDPEYNLMVNGLNTFRNILTKCHRRAARKEEYEP